jgi:asparagine synthase (glutamine-hydrolysing)
MCGLVGCYYRVPRAASHSDISPMMAVTGHRGPDSAGMAARGPFAVGVHRLRILDVSAAGDQPFLTPSKDAVLAYNGEIYNYRQLAAELAAAGSVLSSRCDTELVFEAFRRWGVIEACRRFNGMFACAYYDDTRDELWLARDPLGIKPLYYTMRGSACLFASEVKALLAHPSVPAAPDMPAIFAYIALQQFETATPFTGIHAVPPGHILKLSGGREELLAHFDLLDGVDVQRVSSRRTRPGPWLRALEGALRHSVADHLAADVPVAALCSGGLDSSYLAALANRAQPVPGYVADVAHSRPEAERARRVAAHVGMELRPVAITDEDFLSAWPQAAWFNDVPSSFASDTALFLVMRQCQADGVKVVLTGEGADELCCGYPWLRQGQYLAQERTLLARLLGWLPRRVRRSAWPLLAGMQPTQAREWCFGNIDMPDSWRLQSEAVFLLGARPLCRQLELARRLAPVPSSADRMVFAAMLNSLYGHLGSLLQRADRMAMAHSIECRVPYLDRRVLRVALGMPMRLRYRRGTGKWALKQVARTELPGDIVTAHKWGFAVNKDLCRKAAWLLDDGAVADLLGWPRGGRAAIIGELSSARKPIVLHTLVALELWGRIFLRGEDPHRLSEMLAPRALAGRP